MSLISVFLKITTSTWLNLPSSSLVSPPCEPFLWEALLKVVRACSIRSDSNSKDLRLSASYTLQHSLGNQFLFWIIILRLKKVTSAFDSIALSSSSSRSRRALISVFLKIMIRITGLRYLRTLLARMIEAKKCLKAPVLCTKMKEGVGQCQKIQNVQINSTIFKSWQPGIDQPRQGSPGLLLHFHPILPFAHPRAQPLNK